jgi:outer membrane protein assembly factor BamB
MREGWLVCLDATGRGDVTRSAPRWSYRELGSSVSTPAIHDGLIYAADFFGTLHCLDAETGQLQWTHDVGRPVWASPLVADGKVYLATGREVLWTLRAGRQKEVLARTRLHDAVHCSPTAANGTLYVATRRHLYAVEKGE